LPGAYLAQGSGDENPGKGYIRVALVAAPEVTREALSKLRRCLYDD
jgi:aspartate/methionine/tyrosine aminotransferase